MKRKILVTILLTVLFCIVNTKPVIASTELSEAEESILDNLKKEFEIQGKVIEIPSFYLNQAENELRKNQTDLTKEQADAINYKINEAIHIAQTINLETVDIFNNTKAIEKIVLLVKDAASIANYTVSVDILNKTVKVTDTLGNTINLEKATIKQTGLSVSLLSYIYPPVYVSFTLLLLIIIWALAIYEYQSFPKKVTINYYETKD
jgi:hypothetical protein